MPSADLNNDGTVNQLDLSILLTHWGSSEALADLNTDGVVNQLDLSILLSRWGTDGGGTGGDPDDPTPTTMMSSVEQYGITVTFDKAYPVGQYVNGDYFIVGDPSVTVVQIDPEWQMVSSIGREANGAMIDPQWGYQGYLNDSGRRYEASLNVATQLPLTITPHDNPRSLVCTIGGPDPAGAADNEIVTAAVFTIVSSPPPIDSLRPGYGAENKTTHQFSDSLIDLLPKVTPAANAPDWAGIENRLERVFLFHTASPGHQAFDPLASWWSHASRHTPAHAENRGQQRHRYNRGILKLLCNYPNSEKRTTLIRVLQLGIDNYSLLSPTRGAWIQTDGGQGGWFGMEKMPILFAGIVLGDTNGMMRVGFDYAGGRHFDVRLGQARDIRPRFAEDSNCYWHDGSDTTVPSDQRPLGSGVWASSHYYSNPQGEWQSSYRKSGTSQPWVNDAISLWIIKEHMGIDAPTLWNHDPYLDYMDYFASHPSETSVPAWAKAMYLMHRNPDTQGRVPTAEDRYSGLK